MAEFYPKPGGFDLPLSRDEEIGSKRAIAYLRASAGETLDPRQMADLAASVMNIATAQRLGLLPINVQEELNAAADSIYNLPKT